MAIIREYRAKLEENGLFYLAESGQFRAESRRVNSTKAAADLFLHAFKLQEEADEHLIAIVLNAAGNVIGAFRATAGGINGVPFDVGGVVRKALLLNGVSVILAHNHPGGTPRPSSEDLNATEAVKKALELVGLRLLDHIIVTSAGVYTSFREDGYLD